MFVQPCPLACLPGDGALPSAPLPRACLSRLQPELLLTCSLKVISGPEMRKWGQSSLCGKILFPSESTSRHGQGLVLLAFYLQKKEKKSQGLLEADLWNCPAITFQTMETRSPVFGDDSKLAGTAEYRLNGKYSASLAWGILFRGRSAEPRGPSFFPGRRRKPFNLRW